MTNGNGRGSTDNGLDLEDDDTYGGFFTPLINTDPFAKVAIDGFMGSGKTTTGSEIAIGIHKRIGSKKPILFVDTEKGSKFQAKRFAAAGIQVLRRGTRSVADLMRVMQIMRTDKPADILLIDSLTHFWEALVEAYKKEKKKTHLAVNDWGILIPQWKEMVNTPFVDDPYHLVFCGRAGYEYEFEESEVEEGQKPKKEMYKAGVKMKAGGEIGYECNLFLMMERVENVTSRGKKRIRDVHRDCVVIKDRSGHIDGKTFSNPTYENFAVAINAALEAPVNVASQPKGDDGQFFRSDQDRAAWAKRKDIAVEQLEGSLFCRWPSQGGADKVARLEAMNAVFGTRSWTAITSQKVEEIEAGKVRMDAHIAELARRFEIEAAAAIEAKKAEEEADAAALRAKEAQKEADRLAKAANKKKGAEPKEEDKPAAA